MRDGRWEEEGARLTAAVVAAVLLARALGVVALHARLVLARGRRVGDDAHDPLEGLRSSSLGRVEGAEAPLADRLAAGPHLPRLLLADFIRRRDQRVAARGGLVLEAFDGLRSEGLQVLDQGRPLRAAERPEQGRCLGLAVEGHGARCAALEAGELRFIFGLSAHVSAGEILLRSSHGSPM